MLSLLVREVSHGKTDCLNKICLEDGHVFQDTIISSIHCILMYLLSDSRSEGNCVDSDTTECGLPPNLRLQNGRLYFTDSPNITYSKSSLKKFLFQILRRLFEVCIINDLHNKAYFTSSAGPNLLVCMRELSSDFSVLMYLLNGFSFPEFSYPHHRSIKEYIPKNLHFELKSILIDFTRQFNSKRIIDDLALASISCSFLLKHIDFIEDIKTPLEYLLVNAEKNVNNRWPFIKTLLRLIPITPKRALYKAWLKRIESKIRMELIDGLTKDTMGKEHIMFLIAYYRWGHDTNVQCEEGKLFLSLHKLPRSSAATYKDLFIELFFSVYSVCPLIDHAGIEWLSEVVGVDYSNDATELLLFACQQALLDKCPVQFISKLLSQSMAKLDLREVVVEPKFIKMVQKVLFSSKMTTESKNTFVRLFDSPILLELSTKACLLDCLYSSSEDLDWGLVSTDLIFRALLFETDGQIITIALSRWIPKSAPVWKKWSVEFLARFARHTIKYFSVELLSTLVEDILPHLSDKSRNIVLGLVEENVGVVLLLTGCVFPDDLNPERITWLRESDSDSLYLRLLKQLALRRVSLTDSIVYALTIYSRSGDLCKRLLSEGGIFERIKMDYGHVYGGLSPLPQSPILLYKKTLAGSNPWCDLTTNYSLMSFLLSDYLLISSDNILQRIESSCTAVECSDLIHLPISVLSREPALLSKFIEGLFYGDQVVADRAFEAEAIAMIAEEIFPPKQPTVKSGDVTVMSLNEERDFGTDSGSYFSPEVTVDVDDEDSGSFVSDLIIDDA